jgi:hypothetical protein
LAAGEDARTTNWHLMAGGFPAVAATARPITINL